MIIVDPYAGYELGPPSAGSLDLDNDGIIDLLDNDYDNDGIPDDLDDDDNNDGIPDELEIDITSDEDLHEDDEEMPEKYTDGDGIPDKNGPDIDGDGTINNYDDGHDDGDEYEYDLPKGLIKSR